MIDSFQGEYRFLSNFYPSTIQWKGFTWPTVEHAFQAAKTDDHKKQEEIRTARTPGEAKRLGRGVSLREGWEKMKVSVMTELTQLKYEQNPALKARLLATGSQQLVEGNSWGDTFWGVCRGKGKNVLGQILMQVRTLLEVREDTMAVDLRRMLSPEARAELERHDEDVIKRATQPTLQLLLDAHYYWRNSQFERTYKVGGYAYDDVFIHIIMPELFKRMDAKVFEGLGNFALVEPVREDGHECWQCLKCHAREGRETFAQRGCCGNKLV